MYLENIAEGDKMYSLIYGEGICVNATPKDRRIDDFFMCSVKYGTKIIHYTEAGVPDWDKDSCGTQTVFYKDDMNFQPKDFVASKNTLTINQIKKLKDSSSLEMKCPSGIWRNVQQCPMKLVKKAIKNMKTYLFRKTECAGTDK